MKTGTGVARGKGRVKGSVRGVVVDNETGEVV